MVPDCHIHHTHTPIKFLKTCRTVCKNSAPEKVMLTPTSAKNPRFHETQGSTSKEGLQFENQNPMIWDQLRTYTSTFPTKMQTDSQVFFSQCSWFEDYWVGWFCFVLTSFLCVAPSILPLTWLDSPKTHRSACFWLLGRHTPGVVCEPPCLAKTTGFSKVFWLPRISLTKVLLWKTLGMEPT